MRRSDLSTILRQRTLRGLLCAVVVLLVALSIFTMTTTTASAHEKRVVGKYAFVVGFLDEPAYANVKNSIDLTICSGQECTYTVKDGSRVLANPVNDADKTLKAEVSTGSSAPLALPLAPRWGNPGKYSSYFLPSVVGAYTFHITGTLNGDKIDEKFTSSPKTFGEAESLQAYPAVSQTQGDVTKMQSQITEAKDSANRATTLGVIGLIVGALGLITAGIALARKPRPALASAQAAPTPVDSLRG